MDSFSSTGLPQAQSLSEGWRLWDDNPNEWEWGNRARRQHDFSRWLPVYVPISVQEALWRAGRIKYPYRDLNSREAEWVEHRDWVYGLNFTAQKPEQAQRTFLEFESVDDACLVYLNGKPVGQHEGPGASFTFEVGGLLREGENQLIVVVKSITSEESQIGWAEHTRSLKGRMGYGWDFAIRLVKTGILGQVILRYTGPQRLYDLWVQPKLEDNYRKAVINLEVKVDGPAGTEVNFTIGRTNRAVATARGVAGEDGIARATVELDKPELWWPNATPGVKGGQPLYTVTAECVDGSDRIQTTLGLREIKWVTYPENEPEQWPFTLVVNGHKIFQKGWNWVPADSMGGRLAEQKMKRLVRLAKEAGANFLRCWGGADPETQAFYNTCDQLGILVWQEFPLSSAGISNTPPSDPQYLERLAKYAQVVVAARRNHPSLALWGGGNELTWPDGKPLTLDHPYAATLDKVIKEYDPERTFRPSSPLGPHFDADPEKSPLWDVHGSWEYSERWPGPQYWRVNAISPLLHSELGLPGEASLATQQRHLSPKFRSREASNPARRHLGGAWWEHQVTVDRVFGPIDDPELGVLASQWLQADGLRYYIEETRRRWPKTAGIYPWQLNEPCPNIVCTSAVEYSSQPKLAYYAVKQAYRPVSVTAHYPELKFPGQPLRLGIWALNELAGFEDELVVSFQDLAGRELIAPLRQPASVPANQSTKLLDLEVPMPEGFSGVVVVNLTLGPSRNRYLFSNLETEFLRPALQQPELLREMFTGE